MSFLSGSPSNLVNNLLCAECGTSSELVVQGFKSLAAALKIWKEETDDKLFGREREFVSLPTTGKW